MTTANPLFLQKTALDIQITYINANLDTPVPLNVGTAINNIMDVSVPDNVEYEPTATDDTSVAILPVRVTGKLHLHPASPAIQELQQVTEAQTRTDIIIPGIINVKSPSGGWSYSFTNVVITSPFSGFGIAKTVEDYTYSFKSQLPNVTALSILSTAGLVNIV